MSTSCTPTVAAVARIASLASDVIVDVSSVFSPYWTARRTSCLSRPSIISHPESADMGTVLQSIPSTSLVAYTANSSATLSHLLAYALEISSRPIVIHIAAINDLSDAVILRGAVSFFLHSSTVQQAHDNALIASRLAYTERKAVVHVFHIGTSDQEVEEASEDQVELLLSTKSPLNKHTPLTSAGTDEAGGAYETAASHTLALLRRPVLPFTVRGEGYAHTTIITFGSCSIPLDQPGITWISLSLISPFPTSALLRAIPPSSSERILVLEQVHRNPMKYRPIFLDVCSALQQSGAGYSSVASVCLGDTSQCTPDDVNSLISSRANPTPPFHLQLGVPPSLTAESKVPSVPESEALYTNLLFQLFAERTQIVNAPDLVATHGEVATTPEFALGRIRGELRAREELISAVEALLQVADCPQHLHALLSRWLLIKDDNGAENHSLVEQILAGLTGGGFQHPRVDQVLELRNHLSANSRWIIGSDTWSYDLGASGLHHIISSGLNVNLLILDTVPYSKRHEGAARRKLDVGLYAMNHGNVFVASVAIFSSYSQVLQALVEADRYSGPSIILAHIPYTSSQTTALEMLKETKNAVDSGFWPLYRWDPSKEAQRKDPFSLDSDLVKKELQAFLDRQNHLSQLVRTEPELAVELVSNLGDKVKATRRAKAREAYANLLSGIDAIPLLILYASDGGNAERKAKRLAGRATSRGLPTTIMTMDEYGFVTLSQEERHTVLITSTAGQGEPPQNGRMFFKALSAALLTGERIFDKLKYSVFGMGDSHYWPRAEDFIYHNRPAKELDRKLEQLGAERFAALGLGDDQAADGTETGYKLWEPLLWKALGVDGFDMQEAEPEPITAEHIKAASRFLRGTIAEGFADSTTGRIADSDTPLTKMHGIYQQDDRDVRDERQAAGAELAYIFMIRLRLPAGLVTPEQWLAIDEISDEYGAGHFKVTTRQTFQFHGVLKRHVKPIIQKINRALIRTVGTCGDVCQNIVMSSIPSLSKLYEEAYAFAKTLSDRFAPRTTAYHEIWLDQKLIAADAVQAQVQEPLFGAFYMPRKFKIAIAFPPTNDVDVYGNDIGLIAITRENGTLAGFNVLVGGGMGTTSGNKNTYPRMGTMLGFITIDQGIAVCEQILIFQRDNGNRKDRKNARLKYTLDRVGVDFFKSIIEETSGVTFQQPRPFSFDRNTDHFGWQTGEDGLHHFTTFVENGRVQDEPGREFKTAFREIARVHKGRFRLTSNQHVIITEVSDEALPEIKRLLGKYKLDNLNYSGLRLSGAACVAFPTCGLAMAESERYLPVLMDKVEVILEENGLRNDSIVMRMSGCPNGCSRPYLGEVAFVGKAPGTYMMLLGGGYYGHRLNKIYRESVTEPEILAILKPMIKRYAVERFDGERFGDFVVRAGYIAPYEVGKSWYDRMGGEGIHRVAAVQPSAA